MDLNQSQSVGTRIVISPSASAIDSHNLVFTRSQATDSKAEPEENVNVLILQTSVAIVTLLTTLIFDFHNVIRALATPLTITTQSLVKTNLKKKTRMREKKGRGN